MELEWCIILNRDKDNPFYRCNIRQTDGFLLLLYYTSENLAALLERNERNIVGVVMEKVEPNGDLGLLDKAQLDK